MKWLAIINPFADHHTPGQLSALAKDLSGKLGADCAWTDCPRHAQEIARNARGYEGVVAVGGDGTISEVINGLADSTACVAFIPAGTGNGLARDLAMNNERGALRALRRPRFARLDLISVRWLAAGRWQERRELSTSALGYV